MNRKTRPSVLIVDDNPKNLQILADMLRNRNYRVAIAKDGFSALKFAFKMTPDLILLDIMMPQMDGFEVCRRLKSHHATKEIPVIFISALNNTADKVKAFKTGGVDYITKPFQQEEVMVRVRTHIELKRSQEELRLSYKKLQAAYNELTLAARTDSLTKLFNRLHIIEKMEAERKKIQNSGKVFSLILSDIDDFKTFNDRYGHDCGDFVLLSVADVMRSKVREEDVVSRWGGEEFLLLLPETDIKGAKLVAEKILQEFSDNVYEYNHYRLKIRMTFGISTYSPAESIDICIKMADEALYQGKKSGKNCIVLSGSA
ncbi:MAG: hypothetical protein BWK80_37270 [Desulfobacteraceae bacterium IS3]|nr:MAG: hypothetical protein BWK80_37270 [Desulfobacteraceae bacterium IS3]